MILQPASFARVIAVIVCSAGLFGCAGHTPYPRTASPSPPSPPVVSSNPGKVVPERSPGERAAVVAVRQVGVPYRYGGASRDGFDCSGLIQYAYKQAGVTVPRTTGSQWRGLQAVSHDDMQIGDVLFFRIRGRMSHVGMYLGDGRFVHAPSSGREVTVAALDTPFYRRAFIRAGRP
ncbi:MAG: C40 family peptidase [Woeseia sp.]